jgi:hypothetical protein
VFTAVFMTKRPYIFQAREADPNNEGWWRFSRPVLKWVRLSDLPDFSCEGPRFMSAAGRPHAILREEVRRWEAMTSR